MTQDEMRTVLGLGPDWQRMWVGAWPRASVAHRCAEPHGPEGTDQSEWVTLAYEPTATPGIEAARCQRCRAAWVRRV